MKTRIFHYFDHVDLVFSVMMIIRKYVDFY